MSVQYEDDSDSGSQSTLSLSSFMPIQHDNSRMIYKQSAPQTALLNQPIYRPKAIKGDKSVPSIVLVKPKTKKRKNKHKYESDSDGEPVYYVTDKKKKREEIEYQQFHQQQQQQQHNQHQNPQHQNPQQHIHQYSNSQHLQQQQFLSSQQQQNSFVPPQQMQQTSQIQHQQQQQMQQQQLKPSSLFMNHLNNLCNLLKQIEDPNGKLLAMATCNIMLCKALGILPSSQQPTNQQQQQQMVQQQSPMKPTSRRGSIDLDLFKCQTPDANFGIQFTNPFASPPNRPNSPVGFVMSMSPKKSERKVPERSISPLPISEQVQSENGNEQQPAISTNTVSTNISTSIPTNPPTTNSQPS